MMPDPLFLDSRIAAVLAPQGPRNRSRKDERHRAGAGVRGFWSEAKKPGGHKTLRPWGGPGATPSVRRGSKETCKGLTVLRAPGEFESGGDLSQHGCPEPTQ